MAIGTALSLSVQGSGREWAGVARHDDVSVPMHRDAHRLLWRPVVELFGPERDEWFDIDVEPCVEQRDTE